MTLQQQIEKVLMAEKRDETWYEFFERLDSDGRIDARAMFYGLAVILDYLDDKPWETNIPSFDPTPDEEVVTFTDRGGKERKKIVPKKAKTKKK